MASNSPTVGAPGFSSKMCVAPALMAWRKKPGVSQVRPAMRAMLGEDVAPEKSDPLSTDAWNWTPFAFHLAAISAKAFPGGRSLPAPRKKGSTTSDSRARGSSPFSSCRAWYQPMPRPSTPQPMMA